MKRSGTRLSALIVALLVGTSAFAGPATDFSGYFSGYYAPANWTSLKYNNPLYQDTAFVYTGGTPNSLEIDGAVNSQGQVGSPNLPVSIIDYTIVLPGSGLQQVTFNYSFTGLAAGGYDSASIIYNGAVVASLSALLNGTQQTYFNNTTFVANGVNTFGFRVNSNNDSLADVLIISAVPEPSALTLLGLGAGALLWRLRRRQ